MVNELGIFVFVEKLNKLEAIKRDEFFSLCEIMAERSCFTHAFEVFIRQLKDWKTIKICFHTFSDCEAS